MIYFKLAQKLLLTIALVAFDANAQGTDEPKNITGSLNPLAVLPMSQFKTFIERPLFSSTRRAAEAERAVEEVPETDKVQELDIQLLGVVIGPSGASALILNNADSTSHSLTKGDTLDGWTVLSIDATTLDMANGDATKSFTVFKQTHSIVDAPTDSDDVPKLAKEDAQKPELEPKRNVRVVKTWN